ncbi:MAG: glycosyltransferase family 39 protein [Planctomycetaceae bacterium]|jgi:hypothetical protein|nr:glycosyltransferase family 39 protein [Planctomycetaceae bacterium]
MNHTELGHVGSAVYFYHTFRFDVFHVNPPLTRYIVSGCLNIVETEQGKKYKSPDTGKRYEWQIGNSFINANTPQLIHLYLFFARCSFIPIILLGSYFGYQLAVELYGQVSGIIFLLLWIFSPLVLSWGATLCPDVCAASLGIIGIYTFWHWLQTPTWRKTIIAGICLGLLPLTKLTWIIALPLWIIIWAIWTLPYYFFKVKPNIPRIIPSWKQLIMIIFISIYLINMGYLFDGSFQLLKDYKFISQTLTGLNISDKIQTVKTGNRFTNSWLGYICIPLPSEFVQGIDTQKFDFERGIESYWRGEYSKHGWYHYYAYIILIKEPLGTLLLGISAILVTCFLPKYNNWQNEIVIFLPCVVLFIFVSSQTGFSLHPRYIIPALPFAYIGISKLGQSFAKRQKTLSAIMIGLLIWMLWSSLYCFPHSMSYFNELIGGFQNAPKHLLGSNIDWGQNSYFLQKWYNKHQEARPIKIAYSSIESLDRLGIKNNQQPLENPESGWFMIGVNELYSSSKRYEYFKQFEPVDRIGYSIYIYHLTYEEINRLCPKK